jgi:hypothetical protein
LTASQESLYFQTQYDGLKTLAAIPEVQSFRMKAS